MRVRSLAAPAATAVIFTLVQFSYADAINVLSIASNGGRYAMVAGWEFRTGASPVVVSKLGVFDHSRINEVDLGIPAYLRTEHSVAIYDASSKSQVTVATVPAGTGAALSGFFRYVDVTPVQLAANHDYVIAASWAGDGDRLLWPDESDPLTVNPLISLGLARYEHGTSVLEFPDVQDDFNRSLVLGPNFVLAPASAVPLPSSLSMCLALGGAGLLARVWGCRRS